MIALVRGVMRAATDWRSTNSVSGSTSAKTGVAPSYSAQFDEAAEVIAVTITSSPGPTATACTAACRAAVPLQTTTACVAPTLAASALGRSAADSSRQHRNAPRRKVDTIERPYFRRP